MTDVQTIQQIKAQAPEDLWQFLLALPGSFEAQLLYGLMLSGIVGMVANYTVNWAKGDIAGSLVAYLFLENFRRTLLSIVTFAGLAITSIAAGIFMTGAGAFVGWANVLWFGAANGFGVDAIANKGRRAEWTE